METKLLKIFQLCLDINRRGLWIVLFDFGGTSKIVSVSLYEDRLSHESIVWSGRVFTSMKQADEQADEVIKMLETFNLQVPCVTL